MQRVRKTLNSTIRKINDKRVNLDAECEPPPAKKMLLDNDMDKLLSPTAEDKKIEELKQAHCKHVLSLKKKLKVSQQKVRRLNKRNESLKGIVKELKERDLISSACQEMLQRNLNGVPIALFKRMTSSKSGKGCKYSPELKSFALTLQFYSAKAYDFVRKTFNLALPHPVQIRKWYTKVQAEPGFTEPSFQALSQRVKSNGKNVVASLMLDEMAIRKHVSWDGKKFRGYVDLGNDAKDDDSAPIAKDALVLMVVGINETWKVPVGYFFIDGLSGKERANLINVCIKKLYDVGVDIISLTCDGPSCHFAMLHALGANLRPPNIKPYFTHPSNREKKIYILLDVCHMLKLIRNTLGDVGILIDKDNAISWQYIIELQKLQEKEGLRLGNKLKLSHIQWWQQKMKVNLAAQTISASVADAIDYCRDTLKLPQFKDSEATVKFIRTFDHLFDILNSRNPCAKGFKAALRKSNKHSWSPFLTEAREYITGLRNPSGDLMYTTRRKTGFVGFLVAIDSIKEMFLELVEKDGAQMKYLLTYKFSQDHLELFFGAIRSPGGFNNNPTAEQFTAAYKRLLLRSSIQGSNGNCTKQDETDILEVIGDTFKAKDKTSDLTIDDAALIRKYDLQGTNENQDDDDNYTNAPRFSSLSEFKQASISYMAGYVAQMVQKKTNCAICHEAVGSRNHKSESAFLTLKDRGNLFKPTTSVILVCNETERCFQRMLAATQGMLPQCKGIPDAIALSVLNSISKQTVFKGLDSHMLDTTVNDNHTFKLINNISKSYCKVRLYQLGKTTTEMATKNKLRKKLSKLVLFEHQ